VEQEWKKALDKALENIETIGFFAAVGMHFAESTPLLSEDLGDSVKGSPWERFSSTDQCLKMIHHLAGEAWRNLEGMAAFVKPEVGEKKELLRKIIEPEESKDAIELPYNFQTIVGELRRLKTVGESIVFLSGDEKQAPELDHAQVKSLGEMIIHAATTINENFQQGREKINKESSGGGGIVNLMGKPLELIRGEINSIKAFGSSLVAMSMAFHDGYKINPRQIETLGKLIVDLAEKVTKKLTQTGRGPY
jgi:hypothetical protein